MDFIVIADPNGAGKSTTSKHILKPFNIEAFDWDKLFYSKWEKFDFDPVVVDGIKSSVDIDFQKHVETAFTQKRPVAYETNFHSFHNFELAKKARNLGYRNSLYFLALSDPKIAIKRVAKRVREGGHDVSKATIEDRFIRGLKFLDQEALTYFDKVFIYDASTIFKLQIVFENKKLLHYVEDINTEIINKLPSIKVVLNRAIDENT